MGSLPPPPPHLPLPRSWALSSFCPLALVPGLGAFKTVGVRARVAPQPSPSGGHDASRPSWLDGEGFWLLPQSPARLRGLWEGTLGPGDVRTGNLRGNSLLSP